MKAKKTFLVAALMLALAATGVEAAKGKGGGGGGGGKGGGGGGTPTNYGCQTFPAGKVFVSATGTGTKTLLASTYTCYICNMETRVCAVQSPSFLVGYTFTF